MVLKKLTPPQQAVILKQLSGKLTQFTATEAEKEAMMQVLDMANELCEQTNAYEEVGDDLVKWFYDKYRESFKE